MPHGFERCGPGWTLNRRGMNLGTQAFQKSARQVFGFDIEAPLLDRSHFVFRCNGHRKPRSDGFQSGQQLTQHSVRIAAR